MSDDSALLISALTRLTALKSLRLCGVPAVTDEALDEVMTMLSYYHIIRGLGGVVGLMLPLALAAAVRVPYTTSPCSDLGQVVNLSLSVA